MAFEVGKLVAMDFADFLAVSELFFHALLAEEILGFHVLAQCSIEIVLASIVDSLALEAIVESHLVHHELEWISFLSLCETCSQVIPVENLERGLTDLFLFGLGVGE